MRHVVTRVVKSKKKPEEVPSKPVRDKERARKIEENSVQLQNRKKFITYRNSAADKIVDAMLYLNAFLAATVRAETTIQGFLQNTDFTIIEDAGRKQLDKDINLFMRIFFAREFGINMLQLSPEDALENAVKYVLESNSATAKQSTLIDLLTKKGQSSKGQVPPDVSALMGLVKGLSEKKGAEFPFGKP